MHFHKDKKENTTAFDLVCGALIETEKINSINESTEVVQFSSLTHNLMKRLLICNAFKVM